MFFFPFHRPNSIILYILSSCSRVDLLTTSWVPASTLSNILQISIKWSKEWPIKYTVEKPEENSSLPAKYVPNSIKINKDRIASTSRTPQTDTQKLAEVEPERIHLISRTRFSTEQ